MKLYHPAVVSDKPVYSILQILQIGIFPVTVNAVHTGMVFDMAGVAAVFGDDEGTPPGPRLPNGEDSGSPPVFSVTLLRKR